MCKNLVFLLIISLSIIFTQQNYAQSNQAKKDNLKKEVTNESLYYAPIRYVIIYDLLFNENERRLHILMDEKQFTESNLITVFDLIKKRFPKPARLWIEVHTNLATIETPEEREMLRDSLDSRFLHTRHKYKKASYLRFENGRESFGYTTSLFPKYLEKEIVLSEGNNN